MGLAAAIALVIGACAHFLPDAAALAPLPTVILVLTTLVAALLSLIALRTLPALPAPPRARFWPLLARVVAFTSRFIAADRPPRGAPIFGR